jgi:hypothetical protein
MPTTSIISYTTSSNISVLPVATERHAVVSLPRGATRWPGLGVQVSLSLEATVFAASSCETAQFAVLVHSLADPVDAGVVADRLVGGVDHNNLEVLVYGILIYPVRVQDTKAAALTANTLFCHSSQISHGLELRDTLIDGLAIDDTLQNAIVAAPLWHEQNRKRRTREQWKLAGRFQNVDIGFAKESENAGEPFDIFQKTKTTPAR